MGGIISVVQGVKQTLVHVRDELGAIPIVALCGSVALYLLEHNAFMLRGVSGMSVPV